MNRILLLVVLWCGCLAACQKTVTDVQQMQAQLTIDTNIIRKYINTTQGLGIVNKDKTGVFYVIDTLGNGSSLFTSSTLVTVGYAGRVLGSTVPFAQTSNFHPSYTLGQVILGWQYGIPHITKGGTIRLFVPSGYAYGAYPQDSLKIPANAILDFTIKLYDVNN